MCTRQAGRGRHRGSTRDLLSPALYRRLGSAGHAALVHLAESKPCGGAGPAGRLLAVDCPVSALAFRVVLGFDDCRRRFAVAGRSAQLLGRELCRPDSAWSRLRGLVAARPVVARNREQAGHLPALNDRPTVLAHRAGVTPRRRRSRPYLGRGLVPCWAAGPGCGRSTSRRRRCEQITAPLT